MGTANRRSIGLAVARDAFRFFGNVLQGIAEYAERKPNWNFVPVLVEQGAPRPCGPQQLDGLLASVETAEVAKRLQRWGRPVVDVGLMLPGLPFPFVRADHAAMGRLAFEHFFQRGLRRFAFVGVRTGLYSSLREEAFRYAVCGAGFELRTYRIRFRREELFDPPIWPADSRMLLWLKDLPKPIGLFVPSDLLGFQMIEACRFLGIAVPDEIAILGVDNDEQICRLAKPPLSSIVLPSKEIGFEAARLLEKLMEGRRPRSLQVLLPPCGIETRQSTDILATNVLRLRPPSASCATTHIGRCASAMCCAPFRSVGALSSGASGGSWDIRSDRKSFACTWNVPGSCWPPATCQSSRSLSTPGLPMAAISPSCSARHMDGRRRAFAPRLAGDPRLSSRDQKAYVYGANSIDGDGSEALAQHSRSPPPVEAFARTLKVHRKTARRQWEKMQQDPKAEDADPGLLDLLASPDYSRLM